MNFIVRQCTLACALLLVCSSLQAAFSIYTGTDLNTNPFPPAVTNNKNTVITPVVSLAAENAFKTALGANNINFGTETFEHSPYGATSVLTPLDLVFGTYGTGDLTSTTLNYAGRVREQASGTNGQGRYPISSTHYFESGIPDLNPPGPTLVDGDFTIAFDSPVGAFGFYAIDIGDKPMIQGVPDQGDGGRLELTFYNGLSTVYTATIGADNTVGGIIYFGLIGDASELPFTSVLFHNTRFNFDYVGYDNFTIGNAAPTDIGTVPEPGMLTIWGLGSLAFGLVAARRKVMA